MKYSYKTKDTCSTEITFEIEDKIITDVNFTGGCSANLQLISKLVEGFTIEEVENYCKNIVCGRRGTSCADQLAMAVREAYSV